MTLLEILAVELKEWPEATAPVSGDDLCCAVACGAGGAEVYFSHTRAVMKVSRSPAEAVGVFVTRQEWIEARTQYLLRVSKLPWPNGATHYVPAQTRAENDVFYALEGDKYTAAWAFHGGRADPVNNSNSKRGRHNLPGAVERSEIPALSLPPIGAKAVVAGSVGLDFIQNWKDGDEIECVGHYEQQGAMLALFVNKRVYSFSTLRQDCYKLVSDIESEAVERIRADLGLDADIARIVYEKGYRKQADK